MLLNLPTLRFVLLAILAIVVIRVPIFAAEEKPVLIPRKVLFGNPDKSSPSISPDGKRLSYLAPVDGVMNVWVGPAERPDEAKPVTHDKKRGIRSYFWAYTSTQILYVQDADGDENWHVYRADLDSGEIKDLTPLPKVRAQIEGVSHRFPDEILVGLNDRDPQFHDVYRLNLEDRRQGTGAEEHRIRRLHGRRRLSHSLRPEIRSRRRHADAEAGRQGRLDRIPQDPASATR